MHPFKTTLLMMLLTGPAGAQEIARLYAARAPAGAAYVRVVNPGGQALQVAFAGKAATLQRDSATDYRIVDAAAPMALKANGKALTPVAVKAGAFHTVVVADGAALLLTDATDSRDDLKAELRFYNLARGCDASLALRGGPAVFPSVAYPATMKRNINPVKAELVATCAGAGSTAPVALPALKSGDHVSLFLSGGPGQPRLQVQLDATER